MKPSTYAFNSDRMTKWYDNLEDFVANCFTTVSAVAACLTTYQKTLLLGQGGNNNLSEL